MDLLLILLLMASLALCLAPFLQRRLAGRSIERRLLRYCAQKPTQQAEAPSGNGLVQLLALLGRPLLGRGNASAKLGAELTSAGWPQPQAPAIFTGGKLLGAIAAAVLAAQLAGPDNGLRNGLIVGLVAYLLPGILLSRRATARTVRMRAELPVAIDVLVMVLEGGAGVEQALRFSVGLPIHPAPMSQRAFRSFVNDLERGTPYDLSLLRLGEKLGIEEGRLVVEVLRQALVHGTELMEPLRSLANDLRLRRLADARAAVGKATTMMTLVMVTCLMPALLVLIGAPAVNSIMQTLGNLR